MSSIALLLSPHIAPSHTSYPHPTLHTLIPHPHTSSHTLTPSSHTLTPSSHILTHLTPSSTPSHTSQSTEGDSSTITGSKHGNH